MTQRLQPQHLEEPNAEPSARDEPTPPSGGEARGSHAATAVDGPDRSAPPIPTDVTTPLAKLVYVSLWTMRRADVADLSRATRVPQIRLYPVLDTLADRGHVDTDGSTFSLAGAS